MLGGRHREDAVDQSIGETLERPGPPPRPEGGRVHDVVGELDARVGGVDRLATGSARAREAPPQLAGRDHHRTTYPQIAGQGHDPAYATPPMDAIVSYPGPG